MFRILLGIFFVLHGLVHMLYFGQSSRYFELQSGMAWPDGAWAFSRFFGNTIVRSTAGILLIIAALGFVVGGSGLFLRQEWWRPIIIGAAIFSSAIYILFWDGALQNLDNKGGVGILINLAILVILLLFQGFIFET